MKTFRSIEFYTGTREEQLPDFSTDFPYVASCVDLNKYSGRFVPWHWHKAVELFYIETGTLEYRTPKGKILFPAGSGGMVNSNVLHMTKPQGENIKTVQLIHIFDTSFIAGEHGSRIEQKYILPITTAPQLEIIALYPDSQPQKRILDLIQNAIHLPEQEFGYEIRLREILSEIWLSLFEVSSSILEEKKKHDKTNDKVKMMMIYIHEHYAGKISIPDLAAAAYLSERECYRVFHDCLHMTPTEYITGYRLQMACQMLANSQEPVTAISHACGLGSSSYFGKVFREYMGYTPVDYRRKWQNFDR
ncbi:AraC family transcriptional regulator [Anaerobium acetethylicum]|uniref:AraC-type DNA-binding protein n=1 Tax=Anaerobium acetethylicum TaxID=1619234 RepID=A0A1D3TUH0_9FIRM|nr:AraC family transcriptional regulator [Anaerobium acetethylicum]SCP97720.1 AraC-type DNA-binding protein [Anaerobium acetethylicum]